MCVQGLTRIVLVKDFSYWGRDGCLLRVASVRSADDQSTSNDKPAIVLLHGGGPDHESLVPLAQRLADLHRVFLPDIRGYGRSICRDPHAHTWARYVEDIVALLDQLGLDKAILAGTGLGSTICLRTAVAHPDRVRALVLISVEDIEDDEAKKAESAFMDAFAERVRSGGIEAGWEPILPTLAPIIGTMVRDAIPRSDPESIAAAAAIGHDRSFRSIKELREITAPILIFPGVDARHPAVLAKNLAAMLPNAHLATERFTDGIRTIDEFAQTLVPSIRDFLNKVSGQGPLD